MSIKKISDDAIKIAYSLFTLLGRNEAASVLNLHQDTIRRYVTEYKKRFGVNDTDNIIEKIKKMYTKDDLALLLKGKSATIKNTEKINFSGNRLKICVLSDLHIGSKYFIEELYNAAIKEAELTDVDFFVISGDITEGYSTRIPGHVFELESIGFENQYQHAISVLSKITKKVYVIDGNHDRWYSTQNGANIVKMLCDKLENFIYLGNDEGDLDIDGVKIRLFHGGDGAAFTLSYRLQKIVDSYRGGGKPHLLIAGHDHKSLYIFYRNIHCLGAGCLQNQTSFLRGKKIAVMPGFWILDMVIGDGEIKKIAPCWYPYYRD